MIYIIEDSDLKIQKIEAFLLSNGIQEEKLCIFKSYQTGTKAILNEPPSLVILDMSIPTFDKTVNSREGRLRPLGGYDIMKKISFKNIRTDARSRRRIMRKAANYANSINKKNKMKL